RHRMRRRGKRQHLYAPRNKSACCPEDKAWQEHQPVLQVRARAHLRKKTLYGPKQIHDWKGERSFPDLTQIVADDYSLPEGIEFRFRDPGYREWILIALTEHAAPE